MTPYFFIYGLVATGILICFIGDATFRRVAQFLYCLVMLFALALFAGMRSPNVDHDFQNYTTWFDLIQSGHAPLFAWIRDPAFAILSWASAKLGMGYVAVAFTYALLALAATWRFAVAVSSERWATLFFYLLFCQYFIVLEMTEIRAAVAIPLMALSLYQASRNRRRQAVFTYLLALVFHFSVIVALPLLVLLFAGARFRTRRWFFALAVVGAIASVTMRGVIDLLSNVYRISEYLNQGAIEGGQRIYSWYALAHLLTIGVLLVFFWKKLRLHERMAALACSLGLTLFVIFGWNSGLATRLLDVFDIYWLLIMMMILERLKTSTRVVFAGLLTILGFVLYCASLRLIEPYSVFRSWDARLSQPFAIESCPSHARRLLAANLPAEVTRS